MIPHGANNVNETILAQLRTQTDAATSKAYSELSSWMHPSADEGNAATKATREIKAPSSSGGFAIDHAMTQPDDRSSSASASLLSSQYKNYSAIESTSKLGSRCVSEALISTDIEEGTTVQHSPAEKDVRIANASFSKILNSASETTSVDLTASTCSRASSVNSFDRDQDRPNMMDTYDAVHTMSHEAIGNVLPAMDMPSMHLGRALVVFASAIYGTNFATVKMLDEAMPMEISAALRFTLAAAAAGVIVFGQECMTCEDETVARERLGSLMGGMEIGFWYFLGYASQAICLDTVSAGKSAFFSALAVVIVPIMDAVFKKKLLKRQNVLAISMACLGVGMLELGPTGITISQGDVFALGQTLFFGLGYWRLEDVTQNYLAYSGRVVLGQLVSVAAGSILIAAAVMLADASNPEKAAVLSFEQWLSWLSDPFIVGSLLWTGLISTALALYLETVALKIVSASELTLIMTSVSLWGAAFAYVTMGETLSLTGFAGGLLILAGCVVGNITPNTKEDSKGTGSEVQNLLDEEQQGWKE